MTDDLIFRAKLVAAILTEHGIAVRAPDDGDQDDWELDRWKMCLRIVRMLSVTNPGVANLGALIQETHRYWLSIGAPGAVDGP